MFFSWSDAMRETKRMRAAGQDVQMVKKWYGWTISDAPVDTSRAYTQIGMAHAHALREHPARHNSRHESYAILLEEMDELWDEIKKDGTNARVVEEASQVGAMVVRFLTEVCE